MSNNFEQLMKTVAALCPNGRIPDTYLVLDLETTGFPNRHRHEYVTQFGYAVVENRKITDTCATMLKTPPGWINEDASRVTGITDEQIQREGIEPKGFYEEVVKLLKLFRKSGSMFVGHNAQKFDGPFLEADFKENDIDFKFGKSEFIDTGMMFKASQLFASPSDHEDLGDFFSRVSEVRSRAKWKLTFAMERLGLDMKYGIDLGSAHDAAFDCKMTHLLLEDLRQRAGLA